RPGEKLYEELLIGDNVEGSGHQKIMTAREQMLSWSEMHPLLNKLDVCCHDFDEECIMKVLLTAHTGYKKTNRKLG
ncbi:polysaccharide biosynthesis protein, partial [Vibrio sp. 10N.261.49.A5]